MHFLTELLVLYLYKTFKLDQSLAQSVNKEWFEFTVFQYITVFQYLKDGYEENGDASQGATWKRQG